jgi:hypothetical protein
MGGRARAACVHAEMELREEKNASEEKGEDAEFAEFH